MSEIKTDKIIPVDAGGTSTLGCTGDTIATGAGTTLNIQGTYSGINSINWDTTAKTTNFTAETNRGYFINTTSGSVTISLPATPVAGSFIGIKDYALTAQTNNIIINPNGNKIQGSTENFRIVTQGGAANLVYVDSTQGWLTYDAAQASDVTEAATFITATGGTVTCCGDYKIHTFTGPGTFTVCSVGNPAGSDTVDYLVVAAGGGGGYGGGGGAGGYRTSYGCCSVSSLPVTATAYTITVGAGGAGGGNGSNGNPSSFFGVVSTGGGGGKFGNCGAAGNPGGSGGGAGGDLGVPDAGGAGNTPPVSPPQGNPGGNHDINYKGGGGGGAGAAGTTWSPSTPLLHGPGGVGLANSISGSPVFYAGGGGGSGDGGAPGGDTSLGGNGGGGPGQYASGTAGTANTGGGGGGGYAAGGGAGGSGIIIIRYRYQ